MMRESGESAQGGAFYLVMMHTSQGIMQSLVPDLAGQLCLWDNEDALGF